MPTDLFLIIAVGAIPVVLGIASIAMSNMKVKKIRQQTNEIEARIEQAKQELDEARKKLESDVANIQEKKGQARQDLLELLASAAAVLNAMENVNDDVAFARALAKLKSSGAPISSLSDENDLRSYLHVLHAIMHTINEPDWTNLLNVRLSEMQDKNLISLSEEARREVTGLINPLRPGNGEECSSEYREFVELLDRFLLHSEENKTQ